MTPSDAIEALKALGLTEAAIADAVGTSQPSINRIRRGITSPSYEIGAALVGLAKRPGKLVRKQGPAPEGVKDAA